MPKDWRKKRSASVSAGIIAQGAGRGIKIGNAAGSASYNRCVHCKKDELLSKNGYCLLNDSCRKAEAEYLLELEKQRDVEEGRQAGFIRPDYWYATQNEIASWEEEEKRELLKRQEAERKQAEAVPIEAQAQALQEAPREMTPRRVVEGRGGSRIIKGGAGIIKRT